MPRAKKRKKKLQGPAHKSSQQNKSKSTAQADCRFIDDGSFQFIADYKWSINLSMDALKPCSISPQAAAKSRAVIPTNYMNFKYKNKMVSIRRITDSSHPAYGQHGLFANRKIAANSWIIDYVGLVESAANESKTSDYIIHFVGSLSCDAEHIGNEARFINDCRNINDQGPNVKFVNYQRDKAQNSPLRLGVFSCSKPIRKGQELLVSYGKGFWKARSKDGS